MKKFRFAFTPKLYIDSLYAVIIVAAATALLLLIGRNKLGEAVIALLFLVPVVWSTARWGQGPGMSAALAAALLFDFFFIPPFYTFTVGSLEGWLILAIFLAVAILVVGRIQTSLTKAQASEREAFFMYELSTLLAAARTQEAVAHGVARFLEQRYLACLVTVSIQPKGQPTETAAYEPRDGIMTGKPDRVLGLLNAWGFAGEVQIWRGDIELPAQDSRLFQNFASQIGQALERTRLIEAEAYMNAAIQSNTISKQRKNA
jgi:K+-sensing histidine kinase KdpD